VFECVARTLCLPRRDSSRRSFPLSKHQRRISQARPPICDTASVDALAADALRLCTREERRDESRRGRHECPRYVSKRVGLPAVILGHSSADREVRPTNA